MKSNRPHIYVLLAFSLILLFAFPSCKKDQLITDSSAQLTFSTDSILFDTVFTTVGSTTRSFTIINPHNQPIRISNIQLAGGNNSPFRINVDGNLVTQASNIEIPANDSLFVFVRVAVNPTNKNSPLVIRDSVVFTTNQNIQKVILEAWGQDAYFHKPNVFPTNGFPAYSIISCNEIWTNDKPHVIYGYAVVDENCTLTMQPGTRVHLHPGATLWVFKGGTLKVKGTATNPVIIQGDRLDADYQELPGQWDRIWLSAGSKDNEIDWAIIKNGTVGIQADTVGSLNPTLRINNSQVRNMAAAALFTQGAVVRANNCVFANSKINAVRLTLGGKYRFVHCTIANYYAISSRSTPAVFINNWYKDVNGFAIPRNIDSAYFGNCIVYGDLEEEIGLDSAFGAAFNYKFDYCLVKGKEAAPFNNSFHFNQVIRNTNPEFKNTADQDYNLTKNSPAIDRASSFITPSLPKDLNDKDRPNTLISNLSDIGAFEFYQ